MKGKKWRPKGWKTFWDRNPIYNTETYFTGNLKREFENGADAMLEEVDKTIEEAEFSALDSLGIQQFTGEQVLCFISYLKENLGKGRRD